MIRIAAVGDVHFGADARGTLAPRFEELNGRADLLLLAGDLTRRGLEEEIAALTDELAPVEVPIVAVFGNHDVESGQQDELRRHLEEHGTHVLEGDAVRIDVDGTSVGVAGTVGFGGGFPGATCADFGEPEMRAFVARARETAASLESALRSLDTDLRIALTHYAPVRDTCAGEKPELFPFLGSYQLEQAIDAGGARIAFHGHAHHGVERGRTARGVPVRNVALPVIRAAYNVYELSPPSVEHVAARSA
ncbi:MAG: metallophosphoesterase [Actinobacteria bacterium]|nr:metallophosphoesterase [Actinomycetota bacterium]